MDSTAISPSDPPGHLLGDATIEGLARYIMDKDARNILVLVGAGASVAAGIPDFRSPETGIYANLGKYNMDDPSDAFSLPLFRQQPEIFYSIAKEMNLWPGNFQPTIVHHFIQLLAEQKRLLRCCTQNIDGLEHAAGLHSDFLVEAHGSFSSSSCIECKQKFNSQQNKRDAFNGTVSRCELCGGLVKPDVVFFGENLPLRFFEVMHHDAPKAELVIIIGTSLQVHPFASLPLCVPKQTPRVLFNMERVGGFMFRFPTDPPVTASVSPAREGEHAGSPAREGSPAVNSETIGTEDATGEMGSTEHGADEEDGEDAGNTSTSSSDGYAQYGDYDTHPTFFRDAFFPGDCQGNILELVKCLGLEGELHKLREGGQ